MAELTSEYLRGIDDYLEIEGPFGDTEGARADLDKFVVLSPGEASMDLLLSGDALRTRVVVGRKGAGKTMYLRKLRERASNDPSVIAESIDDQVHLPGTRHVNTLSQWVDAGGKGSSATDRIAAVGDWFSEDILTEIWMMLWNRAILASLTSRLLYEELLSTILSSRQRSDLLAQVQRLRADLGLGNAPRTAFTFVKQFIDQVDQEVEGDFNPHRAARRMREMLDDVQWDDLSYLLAHALRDHPPVFMYIDAIDEEFAHKPKRWLRCQKGLFYTTMRFLRSEGSLGSRMHIVISVRDIVLSSVFSSEHATRYRSSQHIRSLSWDGPSITAFLRRKIAKLPPGACFPERPHPVSLEGWIGLDTITTRMGSIESVESFALRHTQVLPRDVILLGNQLARCMAAARTRGEAKLSEEEFRGVVEKVGEACGITQLTMVANQAEAEGRDESPRHRVTVPETQMARHDYEAQRVAKLFAVIAGVETLRFGPEELELIREGGREAFGCFDLPSLLWQAGLVGYTEDDVDTFHRTEYLSYFALPRGKEGYVLHPTMRECIGLRAEGRLVSVL